MAGSVDCGIDGSVQNTALDTLFLIVLQAAVVIALGKFIHLALRRYNLPSATSQILVRNVHVMHECEAAARCRGTLACMDFAANNSRSIRRRGSSWGAWACTT